MVDQQPHMARNGVRVAQADQETSARPVVPERDLAQIHRSHVRLDGQLRQDRDPHPGRDHPAHRIEASHLDADLQCCVRALRSRTAGAGPATCPWTGRRSRTRRPRRNARSPACQSMTARHDEHEPVIAVLDHMQAQARACDRRRCRSRRDRPGPPTRLRYCLLPRVRSGRRGSRRRRSRCRAEGTA